MMNIRNSGRHLRFARTAIGTTEEDLTKLTDMSAQKGTPELERTITIVPAPNQYVVIRSIEGKVAFGGTVGVRNRVHAKLSSLLPGDAGHPLVVEHSVSAGLSPVVVNDCNNNVFTTGTRTLEFTGGLGETVNVELYLHYTVTGTAADTSVVERLCLDDTIVTYDLITLVRHT